MVESPQLVLDLSVKQNYIIFVLYTHWLNLDFTSNTIFPSLKFFFFIYHIFEFLNSLLANTISPTYCLKQTLQLMR